IAIGGLGDILICHGSRSSRGDPAERDGPVPRSCVEWRSLETKKGNWPAAEIELGCEGLRITVRVQIGSSARVKVDLCIGRLGRHIAECGQEEGAAFLWRRQGDSFSGTETVRA